MRKYSFIVFILFLFASNALGQCNVQIIPQGSATICSGDSVVLNASAAGGGMVLDQQQLVYNGGTSARNLPGYSEWQSFTAGITGTMTQLDIGMFTLINGTGTLKIFNGTGTGGFLLQSQTVNVFCSGGNCMISFAVNVAVVAGQVYTFQFIPGPGIPDPYGIQVAVPGPYPGGEMAIVDPSGTYLTGFDMVFKTWVGSNIYLQWSNGSTDNSISVNSSGTYYLTATDSAGCVNTDSVLVTVNPSPIISLGSDTSVCTGDTVVLNAGTGFADYEWQDGSTASTFVASLPGVYWVNVTNGNGCSAADSILVSNNNCTPSVAFFASDTTFCEKNCIDFFDISGNNATSWHWSFPGASPNTSTQQNPQSICYNSYGSFDVQLIACNASGCDTLTLSNFISAIQNPVDSIYGLNDTLWSLPFSTYQWYETTGIINGATSQFYVPVQSGSYYCIVTDTNGCVATSNTFLITGFSTLPTASYQLSINPNPNNGIFEIDWNVPAKNENAYCRINDATGRIVFENILTQNKSIINLNLPDGLYVVEVHQGETTLRKKMIIRR